MTLDILNTIFLGIIAFFFLAMTFVSVPLILKLKKTAHEAGELTADVRRQVAPVAARVHSVADDVEAMTHTVRREVDRFGTSMERVSSRVNELAAFAEVVQNEVREPIMRSVATVSGLRRVLRRLF
jgi:methyl-accepting chemotaxis protein